MVLERRNFFTGKKESKVCFFISNCFRIVVAILVMIIASITVGLSCLFEKAWTRKGDREEELFIVKIAKSICALLVIISSVLLIIIVAGLSFIFKKTSIGQDRAKKEGRCIEAFLYAAVNLILCPIVKAFSGVYDFCWSLWDRLDRR